MSGEETKDVNYYFKKHLKYIATLNQSLICPQCEINLLADEPAVNRFTDKPVMTRRDRSICWNCELGNWLIDWGKKHGERIGRNSLEITITRCIKRRFKERCEEIKNALELI